MDGKPLGKWGLRVDNWGFTPSGSWQTCAPARKERVAIVFQNVGTDLVYLRAAPLTDEGYTGANGFYLWPRDSIGFDRAFPWVGPFESTLAAAGGVLSVTEIWDGSE